MTENLKFHSDLSKQRLVGKDSKDRLGDGREGAFLFTAAVYAFQRPVLNIFKTTLAGFKKVH